MSEFKKDHRLYSIWKTMKSRCNNPNRIDYKYYGGRGISVCKAWLNDFWKFVEDMFPTFEEGKTLDRINTDGNYEKTNCRWSTISEQNNNQRKCLSLDYNGEKYNEAELSRLTGVPRTTIQARRNRGFTVKQMVHGK